MKFIEFNPSIEQGNCIIRSFSKLFNKDYNIVKKELNDLAVSLNYKDYREIDVFEKYLNSNNVYLIEETNKKIKDLKLDKGRYCIFCWDKKDFYHMVTVIDNVLYDKNIDSLELYTLRIYKQNN